MIQELENIKEEALKNIGECTNEVELNNVKSKYIGKKSVFNEIMSKMSTLSNDEKKEVGMKSNEVRNLITESLDKKLSSIKTEELNKKLEKDRIDITMPSRKRRHGSLHPLTIVREEIEDLFISMGYDVVDGPEIDSDMNCFEMLNLPKSHPARDAQDSFYITEDMLLRPHTSPMQIRSMLANTEKKPFKLICPGKTYRRDDDDATHSHQFSQIEGLVVGENISLSDLKGTLEIFAKKMFGENREIRFRASYFPFTEPSYEVDVSCFKCDKKGCNICKGTGWIEILGCGMVHPNVLENCGFDHNKYQGFAFGVGIERVASLKYGVNNIRDYFTNDYRFLSYFDRKEM